MKKLLIGVLALCTLFAFAACGPDGKCDECGADGEDVLNYDGSDEVGGLDLGGEYCATCAMAKALEDALGNL